MKISFNWLREFVELPEDAREVGRRLTEVGLTLDGIEDKGDDEILEVDVTSNRGDCLSHLGIAREVSAIYRQPVRMPEIRNLNPQPPESTVNVSVADPTLCARYTARLIHGVNVSPSPEWMTRRLESSGIRPVNNIADITNYVLLEMGHPMHAFDLDHLQSSEILVRPATAGETLETLDGVTRSLNPTMLAITDGREPIALAGIMGGRHSEISEQTSSVLLESAWFDPRTVRQTARSLNLSTEASYRFERGTDIEMAALASDRATGLILELAGGSVASSLIDEYPGRTDLREVHLRRDRIESYLGARIPDPDVGSILENLQFRVRARPEGWSVTCPSYRHDVSTEEDLLEELARYYGYERFPSTLPGWSGEGRGLEWQHEEIGVRETLRGLGYSETCTLAFSERDTEALFAPDDEPVTLRNPLSEDEPVLRTSLVPSILRILRWNLNRGIRNLRLYEIGKVYPTRGEYKQLVLAMTGSIRVASVHEQERKAGFFTLKGDVESLLTRFNVPLDSTSDALPNYYHPGRSVRLGDSTVLGELDENAAGRFRIRQKIYIAEINIEQLYGSGLRTVAVTPIPKYPRIRRDFSLILDRKLRFSDVVAGVRAAGVREIVGIVPFDRLEEGPFPESCYGLAITLEYQAPDRTLTDAEVDQYDRRVLSELESIGARLRG